jgi:hypothetical protein
MGVNEAIDLDQKLLLDQPDQMDRDMARCLQIGGMSVPANVRCREYLDVRVDYHQQPGAKSCCSQ